MYFHTFSPLLYIAEDWLRIMQAYAFSARLLHLHALQCVHLATTLYQHLSVAEEFAGRGSICGRGVREVCAYVGIVLHKTDGETAFANEVVRRMERLIAEIQDVCGGLVVRCT